MVSNIYFNNLVINHFSEVLKLTLQKISIQGNDVTFSYTSQFGNKLLYLIEIKSTSPECTLRIGQKLLLKFTHQYGWEAHKFCAERNLAPQIFAVEDISESWKIIVME